MYTSLHTPVGARGVGSWRAGGGNGGVVVSKSRGRVVHLPGHEASKGVVITRIGGEGATVLHSGVAPVFLLHISYG